MFKLRLIWVIAGFIMLTSMAFANQNKVTMKKITFSSPSKAIQVTQKSPEFQLTLQSNPTTGFSWFLDNYNPKLVEVIGRKYIAPKTKMMGASGYVVWTFKLLPMAFKVPTLTEISLVYTRPWGMTKARKSSFRIFSN